MHLVGAVAGVVFVHFLDLEAFGLKLLGLVDTSLPCGWWSLMQLLCAEPLMGFS